MVSIESEHPVYYIYSMPSRKQILATGEIYHVFNKTIGHENIFIGLKNLNRALQLIDFYRFRSQISYSNFHNLGEKIKIARRELIYATPPLVKIFAYAIMPNHYHFLLQQHEDKGISMFMSNFQNSYAKYFNAKNNREGSLFKEMFKAVRIETDEQFLHVSRYIHLNPVTSYIIELDKLETYPYTSFPIYLTQNKSFVDSQTILSLSKSTKQYKDFVYDQADYQRDLKKLSKNITFE